MSILVKKFYKGFSTKNYAENGGSMSIYNVECIEQDLMNEIFTEIGTRPGMRDYGTRIPIMVFEINDTQSQDIVREDLEKVFSHEPRVRVMNLDVFSSTEKHALIAVAKLNYLEFNVTKDLWIEVRAQ